MYWVSGQNSPAQQTKKPAPNFRKPKTMHVFFLPFFSTFHTNNFIKQTTDQKLNQLPNHMHRVSGQTSPAKQSNSSTKLLQTKVKTILNFLPFFSTFHRNNFIKQINIIVLFGYCVIKENFNKSFIRSLVFYYLFTFLL